MELRTTLARSLCAAHPDEAARLVEGMSLSQAVAFCEALPAGLAARLIERLAAPVAATLLDERAPAAAAEVIRMLPPDVAAAALRPLDEARRDRATARLDEAVRAPLARLLDHPADTAGALMDPRVLAIPDDVTIAEAQRRVREAAREARYNVYVVDRGGKLVGVINLRELMIADADERIAAAMSPATHRLRPEADRHAIVSHPGWREVHALPVADDAGRYLGAVLYRTLRRLEAEIHGALVSPATDTARALGDLFSTAATGLIDAVTAPRGSGR